MRKYGLINYRVIHEYLCDQVIKVNYSAYLLVNIWNVSFRVTECDQPFFTITSHITLLVCECPCGPHMQRILNTIKE